MTFWLWWLTAVILHHCISRQRQSECTFAVLWKTLNTSFVKTERLSSIIPLARGLEKSNRARRQRVLTFYCHVCCCCQRNLTWLEVALNVLENGHFKWEWKIHCGGIVVKYTGVAEKTTLASQKRFVKICLRNCRSFCTLHTYPAENAIVAFPIFY